MTHFRPIVASLATPHRDQPVMRAARGHDSDLWCYWYGYTGPDSALAWHVSHIPTGLTNGDAFTSEADAAAWILARLDDRWRTKRAGVLAREIDKDRAAVPIP